MSRRWKVFFVDDSYRFIGSYKTRELAVERTKMLRDEDFGLRGMWFLLVCGRKAEMVTTTAWMGLIRVLLLMAFIVIVWSTVLKPERTVAILHACGVDLDKLAVYFV